MLVKKTTDLMGIIILFSSIISLQDQYLFRKPNFTVILLYYSVVFCYYVIAKGSKWHQVTVSNLSQADLNFLRCALV